MDLKVLQSAEDIKLIQQLERIVWNMEPIPLHQTITASQNGGLILGAFIDQALVGFSYSFPGYQNGQSYLCSHMLAIHPDFQEQGVGASLKEFQKQKAIDMGYSLITWTFDPLESRNAFLNLSKLNAVCNTYVENCYGEMDDSLNQGLPTDRFKVEWWITSPHVIEKYVPKIREDAIRFKWQLKDKLYPALFDVDMVLTSTHDSEEKNNQILVPIPTQFQNIKKSDNPLAIEWRQYTRKIFQSLFKKDYTVCHLQKEHNQPVHYYVLEKRSNLFLTRKVNSNEN